MVIELEVETSVLVDPSTNIVAVNGPDHYYSVAYAADPATDRVLKVVGDEIPWYFGTAGYATGTVIHSIPEVPGSIYVIGDAGQPRPVILAEVQDTRTEAWGYRAREIIHYLEAKEYKWFALSEDGSTTELDVSGNEFEGNFVACPEESLGLVRNLRSSR